MALEAVDSLAVDRRPVGILFARRLRLEPECAADPLDVDADHARALAPAAERGDREPGEVAHLALVALGDRLADGVAELVRVEALAALVAVVLAEHAVDGRGPAGPRKN